MASREGHSRFHLLPAPKPFCSALRHGSEGTHTLMTRLKVNGRTAQLAEHSWGRREGGGGGGREMQGAFMAFPITTHLAF